MIMKGSSANLTHVSITHRVALDWLSDRIKLDPGIQISEVDSKNQLADILMKGHFTRDYEMRFETGTEKPSSNNQQENFI